MRAGEICIFPQLSEILLPSGGLCAVVMRVYIDESGTHDGAPVMTMAGYLMASQEARRFSREWAKVLRRFGVPYAHMTDCANGYGYFGKMDIGDRIKFNKILISHIRRRTVFGFGVNIDPIHYKKSVGQIEGAPSAYSFCALACLNQISKWCENSGYNGKVAYFFEAGHRNASEANLLMTQITHSPRLMAHHRYVARTFADKSSALPLQAADMLAWQSCHYHTRGIQGVTEPRKDFVALLKPQDMAANFTHSSIEQFKAQLEEIKARRGALLPA